jgi:hypothetical protein
LEQYLELSIGFNDFKFAFEGDALNTFTAITSAISCAFEGGFFLAFPYLCSTLGFCGLRDFLSRDAKGFPAGPG